jgi:ketosteroid isomerase-like protein
VPTTTILATSAPSVTTSIVAEAAAPEAVLTEWLTALNDGQLDAVFDLMAADAVWSIPMIELRLDGPVPEEMLWVVEVLGLEGDVVGSDVLRGVFEMQIAVRTVRSVDGCRSEGATVRCQYASVDALTPLRGTAEEGELGLVVGDGVITEVRYDIEQVESADRLEDVDAFLRWAYLEEPTLSLDQDPRDLIGLIEEWEAAERPDVARPADVGADPIELIQAWLDARHEGDWERHVALMGGKALTQEMGSRDDFDAAALLQRTVTLGECAPTLESERVGVVVGCVVTVSDIITMVVGAEPSNPNVSTFQVKDGRITALPEFIPSLFLAEEALEIWGAATYPNDYEEACPFGITNPLGIEDRSCAQFLVDHQGEWTDAVLEPYG